jgi:hypothetical protein
LQGDVTARTLAREMLETEHLAGYIGCSPIDLNSREFNDHFRALPGRNRMLTFRSMTVLFVLLTHATLCCAQTTGGSGSPEPDPAESSPSDLFDQQRRDNSGGSTQPEDTAPETMTRAELEATVRKLRVELDYHLTMIQANTAAIGALQENVSEEIRQTLVAQQKILEAISRQDSSGRPVLNLQANMEASEEFAQDFRQAVQSTHPDSGVVAVRNLTGQVQEIWINNQRHHVVDQNVMQFSVPLGTAVVELPNGTRTTWTIGPPNYQAKIKLVPNTVARRVDPGQTESMPLDRTVTTLMPTVTAPTPPPTVIAPPVVYEYPAVIAPPIIWP